MAGLMEVLEIERVIPDLIDVGSVKFGLAGLEFKDEDHAVNENNSVDAFAEARYDEFQENIAICERSKRLPKHTNFYEPSISL